MAYSVDLIYSKNQDLSNPSTETESGQPSEMELTNLDSYETYYTKAVLKNDGVIEDESDIETFQTLPAGSITLTFVSTVRNGNNYIVTFNVATTYALSSAILTTNNTNFQGAISGNTIVFTVSGLTHGDAYLYSVNAIDIYAESGTANGTITTTVINTVSISEVDEDETDVTCYMTYTIDSGFTQAWVEYWNENDDPSTDQPQGHNTFTDGETSCTLYNLTHGTTYQFRATIYYGGYVNYVVSNVVRATTTGTDYSSQYFTVNNTSNTNNTIKLKTTNDSWRPSVYVSTNNGSTWTNKTATTSGVTLATLAPNESMIIKHTGAMGGVVSNQTRYCTIDATQNFTVSGNIASLCFGDNFNTGSALTMPDLAYISLFFNNTHLLSAENLYFGDYTSVSSKGMYSMFENCSNMTTPPDLSYLTAVSTEGMTRTFGGCAYMTTPPDLSNIVTVGNSAMWLMFYNCTSMNTAPDLSSVTSVGTDAMSQMMWNCTAIQSGPDMSNITTASSSCFYQMFKGCTSMTIGPDLSSLTTVGTSAMYGMFDGCTSIVSVSDMDGVTSVANNGMYSMFSGCSALEYFNMGYVQSVGNYAMQNMFYNCTSLDVGIDLKTITTAGASAFANMYYGCSSLTEAFAPTITWDTSKTSNWLYGVAATGTLTADSSIASSITLNSVSGCPSDWTLDKYYECSDCYNWEECGYSSKEECDCIVNGNCE